MAERDGAAVRVHMRRVVGEAELAQHGQRLRGEGLVELDHVEVADLETEPLAELARRGRGAEAHDARLDARRRAADDRAQAA